MAGGQSRALGKPCLPVGAAPGGGALDPDGAAGVLGRAPSPLQPDGPQPGVSPYLGASRSQPQAFRPKIDPRQRTLLDWVRTLDVYPDPYTYEGQPVRVQGFVVPDEQPDHFVIARFLVSCCAADAYPVGLPVRWFRSEELAPDSWLRLEGRMAVEQRDGQPQLVILAEQVEPMPVPANPYADE